MAEGRRPDDREPKLDSVPEAGKRFCDFFHKAAAFNGIPPTTVDGAPRHQRFALTHARATVRPPPL